ncbi:CHASE domain-containing protein [Shumkonia mesophila]|uniref:CHASE domain-containing protein n=1 Tax=Shumkonia mesophila TaxID=2838854 RepID=UPI0029342BEE|nr:CHASE domain-containing protein [Shumkonia mesophila]
MIARTFRILSTPFSVLASVLVVGGMLSVGLSWASMQIDRSRLVREAEDHLRNHLISIEASLRNNLFALDALAVFFETDAEVSRTEFQTFAGSLLRSHTTIQTLAWIPRVPGEERRDYEEKARRDGISETGITERAAQERPVVAANRDEHFPVFYVEPLSGNEPAVLFDVGSDARRFVALAQARDTSKPIATGRVVLEPEAGNQYGVTIFRPIYRKETQPRTVEDRRRDLVGFVSAVFRIGDLVEQGMEPLHASSQDRHMEVRIFDMTAAGNQLLYPKGGTVDDPTDLQSGISVERTLDVVGRHWRLVALPTTAYEYTKKSANPWMVLGGGLTVTILLAGFAKTAMQRSSDRRAALQSVKESENLFRSFLDNSPNATVLKDIDGRYLIANTAFLKHVNEKDVIGKASSDIFPNDAERRRLMAEHEREVIESRLPIVKEREWRAADDEIGTYIITKFPILDDAGRVVRIGTIATDITARKRTERELHNLNRAYRTLSRCNEILVRSESEKALVASVCRTIVETGGYVGAMVGITEPGKPDEIRPIAQFGRLPETAGIFQIPWDGPACPIVAAVDIPKTRVIADKDDPLAGGPVVDDGEANVMAAFPLSSGERTVGVLAVFGDSPDAFGSDAVALLQELAGDMAFGIAALRTKADHEKAEVEMRKLARAVEQSPAIIIVTNAEGTIEYVNPKFVEITGYSLGEAVGAKPTLLKSGETGAQDYEDLWKTIKSGKEWRGLFHNRRKDGSLFWGEAAISPVFDGEGKITHFIGIQEDVTERLETERRLRHADKMDSLGNLAGGIAHDFNNMLLPIGTLTEMVLKEMEPQSKGHRRLERVLEATQRAQSLAQQILSFSRTDEGEVRTHGISEITVETVNLLKSTLSRSVALDVRIEPDLGAVECDRAQIETVILNLAKNAADAMGQKPGDLRIALEGVLLSSPLKGLASSIDAGRYARLTISDTGKGIEPDKLVKIFEPYFTTKAKGEGTGLGLSMVRTIILKHGGEIIVESRVGVGTTFQIYLPLHDAGDVGVASAAADVGGEHPAT